MATLGTAYVQILPSAEGIGEKMRQAVGAPSKKAGGHAGQLIGNTMKKFIGGAAIGLAIKKSVEEGAKLEQSLGGVETLYKKHADTVIKNANNAYKTAGLSANAYMEQSTMFAASLLQSLDGDTRKASKYADMAIRDMSDNANKFGTNIADIQNAYQGFSKQNYTMLDNLKLGYGGTKTEMERLLRDAEKLSGQKYDISNLSDVYDAIHVIQEEMGVTGTTAKESAETLSGSFASMKAAADNFLGSLALGKNVGPALSGLVTSASTFLFNNLIPAIFNIAKSLPGALFEGLKTGIPQLAQKLPGLIRQFFSTVTSIADQLSEFLLTAFEGDGNDSKIATAAGKFILKLGEAILKGAGKLTLALIKLFGIAIPKALISGIGILLEAVGTLIAKGASKVVSAAKARFAKIEDAITAPITKAKGKVSSTLKKIKEFFPLKIGRIFSNLKIPKIIVYGGKAPFGIGGFGKAPKISVKWAAKGGIVEGATLIGAGEKGKEAIVPLDPFWKRLDNFERRGANIDYDRMGSAVAKALLGLPITAEVQIDGETFVRKTVRLMIKAINKLQALEARKYGHV